MERRDVIAVVAIIGTFVGLSNGFKALRQFSAGQAPHASALARSWIAPLSHEYADLRAHFAPRCPSQQVPHIAEEQAQVMADMQNSLAEMQSQMAAQQAEMAVRQHEKLEADAQQVRRDAMRLRQQAFVMRASLPQQIEVNVPEIDSDALSQSISNLVHTQLAAIRVPVDLQIPSIHVNSHVSTRIVQRMKCKDEGSN